MSEFPTPWTVLVHPVEYGPKNAHGNRTKTWPEDGNEQPVYGWAPPSADAEPPTAGRNAVVRDLDVYAPPEFTVGPDDRVAVLGLPYEVVGHPEDFNHGPFGWTPGIRVSLKRVEEHG